MRTISAVIMGKNEEAVLGTCLKSIKDLCKQIIFIDTGSTDKTIEIAKSFGAEIYEFKFDDDFSAPRNEGLKHVTSDYVLSIDCDEALTPESCKAVQAAIDMVPPNTVFNTRIRNKLDSGEDVLHYNFRIFCHKPSIFWQNAVHETLIFGTDCVQNSVQEIEILHYGYLGIHKKRKGTDDRNMRILQKEVTKHPERPWMKYYLGQQYLVSGKAVEAKKYYKECLSDLQAQKHPDGSAIIELSIFQPLIYMALVQIAQIEKDTQGIIELSKVNTTSPEFYCNIGEYLISVNDFDNAECAFDNAIELRFAPSSAFTEGAQTYKAYCGIGNILVARKQHIKAIDMYKVGLEFKHDHQGLLVAIINNLCVIGRFVDAIDYANKLLKVSPTIDSYLLMAQVYFNDKKFVEGIDILKKHGTPESLTMIYNQLKAQGVNAMADDILKFLKT